MKTNEPTGLFRSLEGASIIDLKFAGVNINGNSLGTGVLASSAKKTVLNNIQIEGKVTGTKRHTGGLVGIASNSKFVDCYFEGVVEGSAGFAGIVGGIVGSASDSTIDRCHVNAIIKGASSGGIAGMITLTVLKDSHSNILIDGESEVGGLVGHVTKQSTISNCYTEGSINVTKEHGGGLVGWIKESEVNNCYSLCKATGSVTGGLIGKALNSSILNSYYLKENNQVGAGGVALSQSQLRDANSFKNWWFAGTPWSIIKGNSPSLPFLPRSGVSLY